MEAITRKPFQGVRNIVRFNWHLYVASAVSVTVMLVLGKLLVVPFLWMYILFAICVIVSTLISLVVSYYIYDYSSLYAFRWLQPVEDSKGMRVVNVHAGFDETSGILQGKFPMATLHVFDFYDPQKHTEVSIERARKAYPAFPGTLKIQTSHFPTQANASDFIFNIFALHEVRNRDERIQFLKLQAKALKDTGSIVLVEHLRNLPNFLAYNIGFFHFLPGGEWRNNFQQAGLYVDHTFTITPFITVFVLRKADGNTP
jgi:hypothetical protein